MDNDLITSIDRIITDFQTAVDEGRDISTFVNPNMNQFETLKYIAKNAKYDSFQYECHSKWIALQIDDILIKIDNDGCFFYKNEKKSSGNKLFDIKYNKPYTKSQITNKLKNLPTVFIVDIVRE